MTKYLMIINKLQYLETVSERWGLRPAFGDRGDTFRVCACSDKMEGKGVNMLMSTNWKPLVKTPLMYYR